MNEDFDQREYANDGPHAYSDPLQPTEAPNEQYTSGVDQTGSDGVNRRSDTA